MRAIPLLLLVFLLSGCGGGSSPSDSTAASAQPGVSEPDAVEGRVVGDLAGEGAVFLLRADGEARDLAGLAETVLAIADLDPDGRFRLPTPPPSAGACEILVLTPGRALTRTLLAPGLVLDPEPEARLVLRLVDPDGRPEADALALVLDATGRPLPLPAHELVSHPDGSVAVGYLPAGPLVVLVDSGDSERQARLEVNLEAGQRRHIELVLRRDPALQRDYLRAVGGSAEHHPLYGSETPR
jgi:hypothetical protein